MKLNIYAEFEETDEVVKCRIKLEGMTFKKVIRVRNQADRVSAKKRAKELAYLGAMVKLHGYVCERKL